MTAIKFIYANVDGHQALRGAELSVLIDQEDSDVCFLLKRNWISYWVRTYHLPIFRLQWIQSAQFLVLSIGDSLLLATMMLSNFLTMIIVLYLRCGCRLCRTRRLGRSPCIPARSTAPGKLSPKRDSEDFTKVGSGQRHAVIITFAGIWTVLKHSSWNDN